MTTLAKMRTILKRLTWTAAVVLIVVFVLTMLTQIVTTLAALVTELGERLVEAGKAAQTAVVAAGTVPDEPEQQMPTGYRTRDMAWSMR